VLDEFQHLTVIKYAFEGIRAGVLALILKAFWTMYKKTPKNLISYIISALAFVMAAILKLNVLYCIIICAVIGLASSVIARRRMEK
jgi:chromate transporter